MSFCSSRLRSSLKEAPKVTIHILSRPLATLHNCNHQIPLNPEAHSSHSHRETPGPLELHSLHQFLQHGSFSNSYFLCKLVSFSAKSGSFHLGAQLHSTVVKLGFVSNVYICSALVDLYAQCGDVRSSRNLFDEMPHRNEVTWSSLISGYLNANYSETAVEVFRNMLREEVDVTPVCVSVCLVGCSQLEAGALGAQVHGLILKYGLDGNVVISTNLINLYSKCYEIDNARRVFDYMVHKNVITWTSMVNGYVQDQQPDEAMILVREMMRWGIGCNFVTYSSLLSSFSGPGYLDCCKQVHCCIIRLGFESNAYVAASLVTVYSKCASSLDEYHDVCRVVNSRDQVVWNAILGGYCNLGFFGEALTCFYKMRQDDIDIDFYALTSLSGAIGNLSALNEGKEIHALIWKTGYASNLYVQNALVSMYAKCGAIIDSKRVFWSMEEHDLISWNALLTGCANYGYGREVVELFEQMRKTEIKPDSTTCLIVLSACSHAGFLDKGLKYFELMRTDGILGLEHYSAVVDIFSRAGHLKEAEAFINEMPVEPGPSVYKALLSACLVHGNRELAARTAKKLLKMCPADPATYVLLSSALAKEGYWDDAADVRKLMCDREVTKNPGHSWI